MRSQTGVMLTFGKGAVFSLSNKQKMNSIRSTVAKIIGMGDAMKFVMWVKLFIEQQVKTISTDSVIKKLGAQPSNHQCFNRTTQVAFALR